jgi:hypothetical protein
MYKTYKINIRQLWGDTQWEVSVNRGENDSDARRICLCANKEDAKTIAEALENTYQNCI